MKTSTRNYSGGHYQNLAIGKSGCSHRKFSCLDCKNFLLKMSVNYWGALQ